MPCHVSLKPVHNSSPNSSFNSSYSSTISCHQSAFSQKRRIVSISELEAVDFSKRNVTPYISPIMDSYVLGRVVKDLGITGKVVTKEIKGRQYVILGGYAGLRNVFRGTVYSQRNAKIIQMAIGSVGLKDMVVRGARLSIYITVPLSILQTVLEDEATVGTLIGRVATDLIKVGIGSIVAALAGLAAGTVTSIAAFPILVTIGVVLLANKVLEEIDQRLGLTDRLIAMIDHAILYIMQSKERLEMELGRKVHQAEREFIFRAYGFDIENPSGIQNQFGY